MYDPKGKHKQKQHKNYVDLFMLILTYFLLCTDGNIYVASFVSDHDGTENHTFYELTPKRESISTLALPFGVDLVYRMHVMFIFSFSRPTISTMHSTFWDQVLIRFKSWNKYRIISSFWTLTEYLLILQKENLDFIYFFPRLKYIDTSQKFRRLLRSF